MARKALKPGPNGELASNHPLRSTWKSMRQRCNNPNVKCFASYGGRGIKVCSKWEGDFWAFVADVGERPAGTSLDRIDGDKDYEPGNVKWSTQSEQLRNQRRNRLLTYEGRTMCLSDWADATGINKFVLTSRLDKLGWPLERALATPVRTTSKQSA